MYFGRRLALLAVGALLVPHYAAAQDDEVEFVVSNRTSDAVTVFANWQGRSRGVRLGELRAGANRTFTTRVRGSDIWLGVDALAGVGGGGVQISGADRYDDEYLSVRAGDRIEWEIRLLNPLDIFYRRLDSLSDDDEIERREPRVTRYTALSAMAIQEAQAQEDEVIQAQLYREALQSIYDGLGREDDNPEAYLHLAIVHTGLANYLAADSAFDRAEALYPEYVDQEGGTGAYRFNGWLEAYNDATVRVEAQDIEGAVELYGLANVIFDKRPEAYLNLGAQAAGLGNLEESIEAWEDAIAVIESPDADAGDDETRETWDIQFWTMAHNNLGRVLEMAGRTEEAVTAYQTLLERYPDNAEVRSSLALALASTGQGDDALSIFDEILASDDSAPLDYFNAGVSLYSADRLEQAVVGFARALERAPMYRDALQNLVQTLSVLENFEAQVPYSTRLLELDPYNEYGYQMHVRALSEAGLQTELVAALEFLRDLPFAIDNLQLQPGASGANLSGAAINKTLSPGTTITLRFTYYDSDGNPLGTEDAEVTISDPDVAHTFRLSFEADVQVLGYSYAFVN